MKSNNKKLKTKTNNLQLYLFNGNISLSRRRIRFIEAVKMGKSGLKKSNID